MEQEKSVPTLVVDDEPDLRNLAVRIVNLTNEGLKVVAEAGTGHEAIDMWHRHRPALVVLDYRLPDRSGLDVARSILSEEPTQVILLYSAYLSPEVLEAAEEVGVTECVSKGNIANLAAALRRCIA